MIGYMTAHSVRSDRNQASFGSRDADVLVAADAGSLKGLSREVALKWDMFGAVLSGLGRLSQSGPVQHSPETKLFPIRAGLIEGAYRDAIVAQLDEALDQLEPALFMLTDADLLGRDVARQALTLLERGIAVRDQLVEAIEARSASYN